jgi:hypothetical protein
MYVSVVIKVPDRADWLAVTRVKDDGEARALGYLDPKTLILVADTLRPLHARVEEEGHPSAETVAAWEDFVNWVDVVAELAPGRHA